MKLTWTNIGKLLWNKLLDISNKINKDVEKNKIKPIILTGTPRGQWAEVQKREWCRRELGEDIIVITCPSKDKYKHRFSHIDDATAISMKANMQGQTSILIDDTLALKDAWESKYINFNDINDDGDDDTSMMINEILDDNNADEDYEEDTNAKVGVFIHFDGNSDVDTIDDVISRIQEISNPKK